MVDELIRQINELAHKEKAGTLTPEEKIRQAELRRQYIDNVRANLRSQLDSIKIKNPDGSITDVKARHDEKMKNENKS